MIINLSPHCSQRINKVSLAFLGEMSVGEIDYLIGQTVMLRFAVAVQYYSGAVRKAASGGLKGDIITHGIELRHRVSDLPCKYVPLFLSGFFHKGGKDLGPLSMKTLLGNPQPYSIYSFAFQNPLRDPFIRKSK